MALNKWIIFNIIIIMFYNQVTQTHKYNDHYCESDMLYVVDTRHKATYADDGKC